MAMPQKQIQTLDGRYIDGEALLKLLTKLFGEGNFKINVNLPHLYNGTPLTLIH